MKTICHFTSVHSRYDPRIFLKQCSSLAKYYNTFLIVADGLGDENKNGVSIIDVGAKHKTRLKRFLLTTYKVFRAAKKTDSVIYEFHDPELLFYGLMLKNRSNRVIFDMHEDTASQILVRDWIPTFLKKVTILFYSFIEKEILKRLDMIFVPQEFMRIKLQNINRTILINNFPLHDFYPDINHKSVVNKLLYVGTITYPRGIINMLNVLEKVDAELTILGSFDPKIEKLVRNHPSWDRVNYLGLLPYEEVKKVYLGDYIGLIPFNNSGQYGNPFVIKLFEYMAFGIPIIMPDFGDWPAFNEKYNVGINTNPEDANAFALSITEMLNNNISIYSENGRKHVKHEFLWDSVEETLLNNYNNLCNQYD